MKNDPRKSATANSSPDWLKQMPQFVIENRDFVVVLFCFISNICNPFSFSE